MNKLVFSKFLIFLILEDTSNIGLCLKSEMKKLFDSVLELVTLLSPLKKKPFKCEICEHCSSRKDRMKQHVQSVHSNVASVTIAFLARAT